MFRRRRRAQASGEAGGPVEAAAPAPDGPSTPDGLPTCASPHTTLRFTPDGGTESVQTVDVLFKKPKKGGK